MSEETSTVPAPADVAEMPLGALRLPSGGWVLFNDGTAYTGKDRKRMRQAYNEDGLGNMLNVAFAAALAIRVEAWSLPGLPNLPIPRWKPEMLDIIRGDDLEAMEGHIEQWAKRAIGMGTTTEGDGPGTPQQPAGV